MPRCRLLEKRCAVAAGTSCPPGVSRFTTDSLRGIAILAVLLNHYLNAFVPGNQEGFANAVICVFFLLSGYGCYLSLSRRSPDGMKISTAVWFYFDRALRFLPVAIALGVLGYARGGSFLRGMGAIFDTWFIMAILYCYAAAVPMFALMRRIPVVTGVAVLVGTVVGTGLYLTGTLPSLIRSALRGYQLVYREVPFGQIVVFWVGMQLARSRFIQSETMATKWALPSSVAASLLLMIGLKMLSLSQEAVWADYAFSIVPLFPLLFAAYLAMRAGIGNRVLALVGTASLPLYIFNEQLNEAVASLAGRSATWVSACVFVGLAILYVLACVLFQAGTDSLISLLRKALAKRTIARPPTSSGGPLS